MEPSVRSLNQIAELNRDLVSNCLDGVSDADANTRVVPHTNSMAFLAAHLADARFFVAKMLGRPTHNPLTETLGDVRSIEEAPELPPVAELRRIWEDASDNLHGCLDEATSEVLSSPSSHGFPANDQTVLGMLAFLMQHESYHVGQLGLLRKGLGYPAMSYERRPERG